MDARTLKRSIAQHVGGAEFITQAQLAAYMGVSRDTARRKLRGLKGVDGKYYFIPEVVNTLLSSTK